MNSTVRLLALVAGTVVFVLGCGKGTPSYSVLPDGQSFSQSSESTNTKLDILWMVDQSGSMATSQQNLADNFTSFIGDFTVKGYDFKMAVTKSDAFLALNNPGFTQFYNTHPQYYEGLPQNMIARFRDGLGSNHSGNFTITNSTTDIVGDFITNILQGVNGYGDERMLQSFKVALESPFNQGFLRPDSFLAIIILTDEDDFSNDSLTYMENQYSNPNLHTIQSYVDFLDDFTDTTGTGRRYQVHTIAIEDDACKTALGAGRKIGTRVIEMANATGGVVGSLCDDFAETLENISHQIITLATRFYLDKEPVPSTIKVYVNSVLVASSGWTYDSVTNSISFTNAPPQGAQISVTFDPVHIEF